MLGEIGPAVAGDLVARAVPARRPVRRPLGVAERHLVGRAARVHGEREADLQQRVLLVPVDRRVELDPARLGVEPHDLREPRPLERDLGAQRRRARAPGVDGREVAPGLERRGVDVPGVVSRPGGRRRARAGCPAPRASRGRWPCAAATRPTPSGESVTRRCAFSSVSPSTRTSSLGVDDARRAERLGRADERRRRPRAARTRPCWRARPPSRRARPRPPRRRPDRARRPRTRGRSTSRAGCRGTAAAGAASRAGRAPRAGSRRAGRRGTRRRAAPARRGDCRASCAPATCRRRGGTRSRARPRRRAGRRPRPRARRRTPRSCAAVVRGRPCRSVARRRVSSMSLVGPPPPSP